MDTFFRPRKEDWERGKTKILILEEEFFSDQAVARSVIKRAIQMVFMITFFTHTNKAKIL